LEEPSPHPRRRQSETPPLRRQDPQSPIGLGNLSRSTRISRDIYAGHLPPCSPCPLEPKRQPEGIGNGGARRQKSFALFSPPLSCSTGEGETRGFSLLSPAPNTNDGSSGCLAVSHCHPRHIIFLSLSRPPALQQQAAVCRL
jgi:hypothetical protein